jgi:hypothetical protein
MPPAVSAGSVPRMWKHGDRVTRIRGPESTVRVQRAERLDWRESLTRLMRLSSRTRNWEWTGADIPDVKPTVSDLTITSDGRFWVKLSQPGILDQSIAIPPSARGGPPTWFDAGKRWREQTVFDVLEPSGKYVGRVRFHPGVGQFDAVSDTIWAAFANDAGEPQIRRFEVRW